MSEAENIRARYARRNKMKKDSVYPYLEKYYRYSYREREEAILEYIQKYLLKDKTIDQLKVLEVGCGTGINLHSFVRFGITPENICGNDLLKERLDIARKTLPAKVELLEGESSLLEKSGSFDFVFQAMLFTSVLDPQLKRKIADKMWNMTKDNGYIIWYDFTFDNPKNKDVKGIKYKEVKELFPKGIVVDKKTLTLAPPIGRLILNKLNSPILYRFFNLFPFLKTHMICIIQKPNKI